MKSMGVYVVNEGEDPVAEIRKKQKLKNLLAIIGENLKDYFIEKIAEKMGDRPKTVSIKDVATKEKGTSRSKVHYITYYLASDVGDVSINLVVKFSSSEERYRRELENYNKFKDIHLRYKGVYTPKIIYTSRQTRAIIYEGISGKSFRECKFDKNYKHRLAGQALAALHGIEVGKIVMEPYKKFLLYLLSLLKNDVLEKEFLDLFLPHFLAIEASMGRTTIHGDFHQGNIIFETSVSSSNNVNDRIEIPKTKVYIIDTEFSLPNRDRCEDIGTFYAKPILREFKEYGTINETKKDIESFINGYNDALKRLGADFSLEELYPQGETIRFHMCFYLLYGITDQIQHGLNLEAEEIKMRIELIRKLLTAEQFY